ncbi:MAG: glycogen debranching enzyme family protein [Chthoniobacterales bacterium]|nr:glycogen debranching enzyme family protein [Chthoniobacterales bacterium]
MRWDCAESSRELLLNREWLVTNGLGGYASGSVSGAITRKYHGILIAGLPAPLGRMVMWSHLSEVLRFANDDVVSLGAEERAGGQLDLHGADYLREFRLEDGLPVWIYKVRELVIEKRILMPHLQNTVHVSYKVTAGTELPRLELRPAFHFRHHEGSVDEGFSAPYKVTAVEGRYEISGSRRRIPPLRMRLFGKESGFTIAAAQIHQVVYRTEQQRGYASEGDLWSPGYFQVNLSQQNTATLVGSTEAWEIMGVLAPEEVLAAERERRARLLAQAAPAAREGVAAELVFAADQFVITPAGRAEDAARAHAAGDEVRTAIAGYHWFTDWGRDTMISLEGLTLTTGRFVEAGYILRTFAHYVRDGLIPNMFPDGKKEGLYHTADATLWFFHALSRYLAFSENRITLELLLPTLIEIAEAHLAGTHFGIHVDPADGLLVQGKEGYQLTWMDAKMGDWVVTPRRGKAVEINALWFNALKLLEGWLRDAGDEDAAQRYEHHASRARLAFNRRFWFEEGGYLYDVVDTFEGGDDSACRPNQIFAISLDHPVLLPERWQSVVDVVQRELFTPFGLRSLSPKHPDYKSTYHGDLRTRDAAYHQGTVWGWLIGPFVDARQKVHPDDSATAHEFLARFPEHLGEAGLGTISEVFDAQEPHLARGCIAQAWSVAEVLRSWVKTSPTAERPRVRSPQWTTV